MLGIGATTPPVKEVSLPASDPLVLGVGGTSLTANPVTGAYISETAWNTPARSESPLLDEGGLGDHRPLGIVTAACEGLGLPDAPRSFVPAAP